jgi:hypothetical protein
MSSFVICFRSASPPRGLGASEVGPVNAGGRCGGVRQDLGRTLGQFGRRSSRASSRRVKLGGPAIRRRGLDLRHCDLARAGVVLTSMGAMSLLSLFRGVVVPPTVEVPTERRSPPRSEGDEALPGRGGSMWSMGNVKSEMCAGTLQYSQWSLARSLTFRSRASFMVYGSCPAFCRARMARSQLRATSRQPG